MSKFDFITGFFSWGEPEKVKPEPTPEPELREPDLPEVETRKRSDRKPDLSKEWVTYEDKESEYNDRRKHPPSTIRLSTNPY